MKKRTLALIVMFALVLTAVFALVACDNTVKYTVKFYDGTTKIKEVEVEEGKAVEDYKPTKDGYAFVAWYEDSSLAGDPFVMTTPIKADTKLFAKWQSTTVTADTRIWYVMGSVAEASWDFPTVKDEATGKWSVVEGMDSQIMDKAEGKNEYTITLTVRAGQKFRFVTGAINSDWTGDESKAEASFGHMKGAEYAAGTNPEDGSAYTAADQKYAVVKNSSGVAEFQGGVENNKTWINWNIWLADGMTDGIYKFTLTTYPGEDDRNEITYERTGDAPVLEKTCKLVLGGTMNGWVGTDESEYVMTAVDVNSKGEGIYKYALTVDTIGTTPEGAEEAISKVEFKVVNTVSDQWWGPLADGKVGDTGYGPGFVVTENGTYMLEVNSVAKTYKFEKAAIRVTGTIDGNGWADGAAQRSAGYKHDMYLMNKVESATEGVEKYELVLEINEKHAASWLKDKVAAIKVDFCAAGYSIWDCGEGVNGTNNIEFDTVGVYKVVLELSYNEGARQTKVTVTKLEGANIPVAMIGATSYDTLVAAVAAAKDGDTIVVYKDITSDGIMIAESRKIAIAIALNGHTVTMGTSLVGSTGTVSQNIHIEKGNAVTIMDGTITSTQNNPSSMLVQNYCDLTLDNVTLDGRNLAATGTVYTLSNNFGTVVIKNGSKIIARETNGVAFDVYYGMSAAYDAGISVTVEKGCTITGKIEYGADARITGTAWLEKASVSLPAGTYDIVYTTTGITAENANITIAPAETPAA